MEWEPINARLFTARFYGTAANISILKGYAPANDAEPEEKAEFYDTLQSTINTKERPSDHYGRFLCKDWQR